MEPILVDFGSCTEAREQICGQHEAQRLQDWAEERCSIVYRAPELFNVQSYCMIDERTDIWSLGCVLYAICFFKCPYDVIYEKGDSVALAVLSGNIDFPENSPYSEVNLIFGRFLYEVDLLKNWFMRNIKKIFLIFRLFLFLGYAQLDRFYAPNKSNGTAVYLQRTRSSSKFDY